MVYMGGEVSLVSVELKADDGRYGTATRTRSEQH